MGEEINFFRHFIVLFCLLLDVPLGGFEHLDGGVASEHFLPLADIFGSRPKAFSSLARLCSLRPLPRFHSFHGLSSMLTSLATRNALGMPFRFWSCGSVPAILW